MKRKITHSFDVDRRRNTEGSCSFGGGNGFCTGAGCSDADGRQSIGRSEFKDGRSGRQNESIYYIGKTRQQLRKIIEKFKQI